MQNSATINSTVTAGGTINSTVTTGSTIASTLTGGGIGPKGVTGNPGPNLIDSSTATSFNGFLVGNGSTVSSISSPISIASGGTGSATQNFVDLTNGQSVGGQKTFAAQLNVEYDYASIRVLNTSDLQYAGAGFMLINTATSMGNEAGIAHYAGINDSLATKGYYAIDQVTSNGGLVGHLVLWDLDAGSFNVYASGYVALQVDAFGHTNIGANIQLSSLATYGYLIVQSRAIAGSDDNGENTILVVQAPDSDPQEATLSLVRDFGSGNKEFTDFADEDYSGADHRVTINVSKRGTGLLRDFGIRYWNQDLGDIAHNGVFGFQMSPASGLGAMAIGPYAAGAYDTTIALQVLAQPTAAYAFAIDSPAGTHNMGITPAGHIIHQAPYPQANIINTQSAQYAGAQILLYNNPGTMGTQAGILMYAGISDVGISQGYFTIAQVDHTGANQGNLLYFDLNAQTVTSYLPLSMNSHKITNVTNPTSAQDAATKNYVDTAVAGGGFANPMTTLGDIIYENATPAAARLAGNTTTTKKYLSQTGTGTISAVPAWAQVAAADISGLATSATTDTTNASNITSGTLPNARLVSVPNSALANSAITIAGTSTSLGGAITIDTIIGLSSTGLIKRSAANTLAIATGSDIPNIAESQVTNLTTDLAAKMTNPMTTLGDIVYGGSSGAVTRLVGDTSNTRKFLRELSSSGVATAPVWDTLLAADIPNITESQVTNLTTDLSARLLLAGGTLTGDVASSYAYAKYSLLNTSTAQYSGSALFMYNTASTMTTQAGVLMYAGINDVSATQGYFTIAQVDHTGANQGNLLFFDLNAQTATMYLPMSMNSKKITSLANGSASSDAAAFGQIPLVDSTTTDIAPLGIQAAGSKGKWADAGHVHPITHARTSFYVFEDFINNVNSSYLLSTVANSGTVTIVTTDAASTVGMSQLNTNSLSNGGAGQWSSSVVGLFFDTSAVWSYETRVKVPTLSNGTDRFQFLAGFQDASFAEAVDGAYFSYIDNENSGDWTIVTSKGSTRTRADSGTAVVAGTWYVLKVVVQSISSTLTAQFFINGVQVGSNTTTNLPNTTSNVFGYGDMLFKSVGTTSRTVDIDYIEVAGLFTGNR